MEGDAKNLDGDISAAQHLDFNRLGRSKVAQVEEIL